ncbi:MAG: hypothetical protein OCD76_12895 [Reichenbachiella sp.]
MKLRVQGNFIRFRINQAELTSFAETGKLETVTQFDNGTLVYSIIRDDKGDSVSSSFDGSRVEISVPNAVVDKWLEDTEVGFENSDQSKMRILVEKDFQCLHKRAGENESDNFPNPLADNLR